jgi:multiphosphoryl transfer protein
MSIGIRAPFAGWSSALAEIPDEVFARGLAGDGVALDPTGNELRSPCDGEVISFAAARHAVALRAAGGAELLVHVGIDTVALAGDGFTQHATVGQQVNAGDLLLSFDLDLLANKARSLVSPVIVTNPDRFRVVRASFDRVVASGDLLFELEAIGAVEATRTASGAEVSETVMVGHAHGIHARPAALIARLAKTLAGEFEIRAHGRRANPRSVVALMSLGVRGGDELTVVGLDAMAAPGVAEIAGLIRTLDHEVPAAEPAPGLSPPPMRVATRPASEPGSARGVIASRGYAVGSAYLFECDDPAVIEAGRGLADESAALEHARRAVRVRLTGRARSATPALREIMSAHLELLDDPQLLDTAMQILRAGKSAAFAWRASLQQSADALEATGDSRLRERTCDLADLSRQVLHALAGDGAESAVIPPGSILIARELTPSQFIDLDAKPGGIALMGGGPTSHVAILAATFGVPMLVNLGATLREVKTGDQVILDAEAGMMKTAPDADTLNRARERIARDIERTAGEISQSQQPGRLATGERIEVFANLAGNAADAASAVAQGAEGCGLLRTEFLFLDRNTAPDEAEQARCYREVAAALDARPLVIRTLDIGGDKPIPYLPLPAEENPALGLRGIRTSLWRPELLDVQLRALLSIPEVRILLPMITDAAEIALIGARLDELCRERGVKRPQLGAMIETPAAAMLADQIAGVVDFVSIGSNDLAQYGLAMDRGHAELAARIDGVHPAVLRLIDATTRGAAVHHCPVAVCGGLASDPEAVPLLIGLGVTELSVVPSFIPRLKALLRELALADCRALARRALQLTTAAEVRALTKELMYSR